MRIRAAGLEEARWKREGRRSGQQSRVTTVLVYGFRIL